ncbi:hypothetical protein FA95DRAFT_1599514 [Auriscalpium vulgare]|uniref:Uncharacterized protein n=1 Tax=Auriscalpium vulgare TaxID=40419 RepID=A0ACB8R9C5_9AGAM|nr:hypothetical protein FA95DRAFT_1599514 [Auriscalpium vulgare]
MSTPYIPEYDSTKPLPRTSWLYPQEGAFVVFTLDPAATLEALEDPVAIEQAKALRSKKYVGYVTQALDLPIASRRYHRCDCFILSKGLPRTSPSLYLEETMCVPIAPATLFTGRPAVTAIPPLPWDDLYIHYSSQFTFRLKIGDHMDHTSSPMLSMNDMAEVEMCFNQDSRRQDELMEASGNIDVESDEESDGYDSQDHTDSESGSIDELPEGLLWAWQDKEDPRDRFIPVASFDLDISTVTEFSGGQELSDEIAAINKIRAESEQRTTCLQHIGDSEDRDLRGQTEEAEAEGSNTRGASPPLTQETSSMLRVVRKIGYAAGTVARRVLLCMRQERFFDGAHEPRREAQTQAAVPVGSPGRRLIRRPVQTFRFAFSSLHSPSGKAEQLPTADSSPRRFRLLASRRSNRRPSIVTHNAMKMLRSVRLFFTSKKPQDSPLSEKIA